MRKVVHEPFERWFRQQNTHDWAQPIMGKKHGLKNNQVNHMAKPVIWQWVRGENNANR
ncbi:hypothetical protein [Lactiplantibacillus mudanjiangensis]|uniref:hypothetical protein n=1 Tax=Lactiplantibacillus mudanjiangensis TaxID=1296538 RepID=UPI0013EF55B2